MKKVLIFVLMTVLLSTVACYRQSRVEITSNLWEQRVEASGPTQLTLAVLHTRSGVGATSQLSSGASATLQPGSRAATSQESEAYKLHKLIADSCAKNPGATCILGPDGAIYIGNPEEAKKGLLGIFENWGSHDIIVTMTAVKNPQETYSFFVRAVDYAKISLRPRVDYNCTVADARTRQVLFRFHKPIYSDGLANRYSEMAREEAGFIVFYRD